MSSVTREVHSPRIVCEERLGAKSEPQIYVVPPAWTALK